MGVFMYKCQKNYLLKNLFTGREIDLCFMIICGVGLTQEMTFVGVPSFCKS